MFTRGQDTSISLLHPIPFGGWNQKESQTISRATICFGFGLAIFPFHSILDLPLRVWLYFCFGVLCSARVVTPTPTRCRRAHNTKVGLKGKIYIYIYHHTLHFTGRVSMFLRIFSAVRPHVVVSFLWSDESCHVSACTSWVPTQH